MKIVTVVQARTGSTRLPNKILMPLAGEPLLRRMLERVRAATTPMQVVVATTPATADDVVVDVARRMDMPCFRGHPTDLLERHVLAARAWNADVVVKIPSDCPLIDPDVIDRVCRAFLDRSDQVDFVSNLHPPSYPDGNDVEVMTLRVLEIAHREATRPHEREHTTPFLWDDPHRFRIANVTWETGLDYSMSHRFTIDYPEDYEFIRTIYDRLWMSRRPVFSLGDILRLLNDEPDIFQLNQKYAGVNWYRHHLDVLKTVGQDQTREPETASGDGNSKQRSPNHG